MPTMTRKTLDAFVTKGPDDCTRTFVITSGAVDRDNDIVNPDGWDFTNFAKNPVALASHDYERWPIGRWGNRRRRGDQILMDCTFAETPEGDTALGLVDAGMLNACSVGFRPLESSYDSQRGGTNFHRQELLEVSICAVPSNPEALVQRAKTLGLSAAVVRKMFGGPQYIADDDVVLAITDDFAHELRAQPRRRSEPFGDAFGRARHVAGELIDVDPHLLVAAMGDAVRAGLREAVPELVKAALARARGRVD